MDLKQQRAAALKAALDIVDAAKAEGRAPTAEELTTIEQKTAEVRDLDARIERAAKAADLVAGLAGLTTAPDGDPDGRKAEDLPFGLRIVKSDAFQAFRKAHPSGFDGGTPMRIEVKGVGGVEDLGMKATLDTTVGRRSPIDRQPGYQNYLDPATNIAPSILNLVTVGSTNSTSLEYAQIVGETNNAAVVAEGQLKPLSDLTTGIADAKVFTYADGFDATNQFLADEPALATFMESSIQRHLRQKIEDLLLNGAGGSTAPRGILNTTGTLAVPFRADVITTLSDTLLALSGTATDVQAIVLNPATAWSLRLLKDTTGNYLSGGPFTTGVVQTLWGIPIVTSPRVAANRAIVGDFRTVNFLQREPISVLAFNQHKDYAQRNMVYVRAELRAMQLIYSPRSLAVATLAAS
jgi:HK97 family phage major capsid protein